MNRPLSIMDIPASKRIPITSEDIPDLEFLSISLRPTDWEIKELCDEDPACQIIIKRLTKFSKESMPSSRTVAVLSVLSGGSPGRCVMLAWWAHCFYKQHGRVIKIPDITEYMTGQDHIPVFPSNETLREIWLQQKDTDGSNMLDKDRTWRL
jgi:hypothetical protein